MSHNTPSGEGYLRGYINVVKLVQICYNKFPLLAPTRNYDIKTSTFKKSSNANNTPWQVKLIQVLLNVGAVFMAFFCGISAYKKFRRFMHYRHPPDILNCFVYITILGVSIQALCCIVTLTYTKHEWSDVLDAVFRLWLSVKLKRKRNS